MYNKKVMILGLDGATWNLIEPWVTKNHLPNFKKIMENGCYGRLESTIPHVTPPAWTSMTSGKNPAKHGIFDFMIIENKDGAYKANLFNSSNKQAKEIWDYLTNKSIVVNVPLTFPPHHINGMMVTGMYTPSINCEFTYPKELKEEIIDLIPDYRIDLSLSEYKQNKEKFLNNLYKMTDDRIKLFWHFHKKDWQFYFFVIIATDRIQHMMWDDHELLRYYTHIDNFLGDIIDTIEHDNSNLFIVSDHGFCKIKKIVHINSILQENGYLKVKEGREKSVLKKTGLNKEKLLDILIKYRIDKFYTKLPSRILDVIRRTVPGKSNPLYDFDLENSKAAMVGSGSIYINEQNGEDKEKILEEIIEILEGLRDPDTNEKIIRKVYKKNDLYSGNFTYKAPDLVILPKEGYSLIHSISDTSIEEPNIKKADHAIDGIFFAYGPSIKNGKKINAKIYDIAPTILHMFNVPIPRDMDGRVLKEIFLEKSKLSKKEIKYEKLDEYRNILKEKINNLKISGKI